MVVVGGVAFGGAYAGAGARPERPAAAQTPAPTSAATDARPDPGHVRAASRLDLGPVDRLPPVEREAPKPAAKRPPGASKYLPAGGIQPVEGDEIAARIEAVKAARALLDVVAPEGLAADADTVLTRGLCDDIVARGEKALAGR